MIKYIAGFRLGGFRPDVPPESFENPDTALAYVKSCGLKVVDAYVKSCGLKVVDEMTNQWSDEKDEEFVFRKSQYVAGIEGWKLDGINEMAEHIGEYRFFVLRSHLLVKLTTTRRENLEKLANYLFALPEDYRGFDMTDYMRHAGSRQEYITSFDAILGVTPSECGAVACALGHGPAAGVPCDLKTPNVTRVYNWERYAKNFIPGTYYDEQTRLTPEYIWLFDYRWAKVDNTPKGAAQRIREMLEHGIPHDYSDQMTGNAPLSYQHWEK